MTTPFNENLRNNSKIIIPYDHLHPKLQKIIGTPPAVPSLSYNKPHKTGDPTRVFEDSLHGARRARGFADGALGFGILTAMATPPDRKHLLVFPTTALIGGRIAAAKFIQRGHKRLASAMKSNEIVQPKFQKEYPEGWEKWLTIAANHPIFYVNARGDLVFLKTNRMEYARHHFQKRWPGKGGFTLWRWRGYLKPPVAPNPLKDSWKQFLQTVHKRWKQGKPRR
jgi:hypothetical protein